MKRLPFLLLLAAGLLGCGTIITKVDGAKDFAGKPISPIYSGARFSYGGISRSDAYYVWAVDTPVSAVADTAVLPISLLQVGYGAVRDLFPKEEEVVLQPEATVVPDRGERSPR
jgi:uncharacterized protein YceK